MGRLMDADSSGDYSVLVASTSQQLQQLGWCQAAESLKFSRRTIPKARWYRSPSGDKIKLAHSPDRPKNAPAVPPRPEQKSNLANVEYRTPTAETEMRDQQDKLRLFRE